ncbi:RNI-like protein [Gonapodya prolifera JEL478]|uniref:RNI-like protein n=1 Tax=Gonapodya prolifera (strain JEL478) TaxID=1344416 RepID=A0A139ACG6_GONPJ|nr:RNI-like protein [Gonapodya prolifera JEL478]|eukprot:KXS14113.1 RNI-like protein [Gonapodya prolifera JEL478]
MAKRVQEFNNDFVFTKLAHEDRAKLEKLLEEWMAEARANKAELIDRIDLHQRTLEGKFVILNRRARRHVKVNLKAHKRTHKSVKTLEMKVDAALSRGTHSQNTRFGPTEIVEYFFPSNDDHLWQMVHANFEGVQDLRLMRASDDTQVELEAEDYPPRSLDERWIDGNYADLRETQIYDITNAICRCSSLKNLCITDIGKSSGPVWGEGIANVLKSNCPLKELNLRFVHLTDDGAGDLAEGLTGNLMLTHLALCDNNIDIEGAQAIADALSINNTLTTLSLQHNSIGSNGAKALANALRKNTAITCLDLDSEGKRSVLLVQSVQATFCVCFAGNDIGVSGAKAVAEALKTNTTLTILSLQYNRISSKGARAIADALTANKNIVELFLSGNGIDDAPTEKQFRALATNKRTMVY